jgi:hypothetical protein
MEYNFLGGGLCHVGARAGAAPARVIKTEVFSIEMLRLARLVAIFKNLNTLFF